MRRRLLLSRRATEGVGNVGAGHACRLRLLRLRGRLRHTILLLAWLCKPRGLRLELRLETRGLWLLKPRRLGLLEPGSLRLLEARRLRLLKASGLGLLETSILLLRLLRPWETRRLRLQSALGKASVLRLQSTLLSKASLLCAEGRWLAGEGLLLWLLAEPLLASAVRAAEVGVGAGEHDCDAPAGRLLIHVGREDGQ